MAPRLGSYGPPPAGARPQSLLELRREQPDQDTEQNGSPVGRAFCPFKRGHAVGDHAPFVLGDARGFLKQRDAVRGESRPLDLKEVIEPVKRGRETVAEHDHEVASAPSFLTDRSSWLGSECRSAGAPCGENGRHRRTVVAGDEQAAGSAI